MTDLMHWHQPDETPSVFVLPPKCCLHQFDQASEADARQAGRAADDAVRKERRRVVASTVEALESYRQSIATVVSDPAQLALADKVAAYCAEVVRRAGCICEPVDVHSFGEAWSRRIVGRPDPLCGVHDVGVAA